MPEGLGLSHVRSVVVVRALSGIADILCIIPALRALRSGLPEADISLLGLRDVRDLVERFPQYVDELILFAGFPGIPEKQFVAAELPPFYEWMVGRRFDLALQMQGDGLVSNSLTVMLGARLTAGFYLPGHYCPDPELFLPYPLDLPEIHRHLALMRFLGLPDEGDHLEFPVSDADRAALDQSLEQAGLGSEAIAGLGDYVCVHPGAMAEPRRWSPNGFARVADSLAAEGFTVVFAGRSFENRLVTAIRSVMKRPSLDLTGSTSLGALAALLQRARLLVCNDTGVSHLAAALHVPSVVVFAGSVAAGSDPARWAPLDSRLHRSVSAPADGNGGQVPVATVLEAVQCQLKQGLRTVDAG